MKCGIDEMVMRPVTAWKCAAEEKIDAELEAATDPELGVTRTERIKTNKMRSATNMKRAENPKIYKLIWPSLIDHKVTLKHALLY